MDRNALGRTALPQLLPDVDVNRQIPDEDMFFLLRAATPQLNGEASLQSSQGQLIAEHSRPSPHLTRCVPSAHHGIMSLQQHRQPSVVVGRDGQVHSHQVTGTLSVPPGLLLDNYGAISVIKNDRDPLKGRLLQHPSEDVHHATIREPLLSPDGHDVISRRHSDHMGLSLEMQVQNSSDHIQRTQKKREKNRIAQQRFRLRQKQLVSDLQSDLKNKILEIEDLNKKNTELADENKVLRDMLFKMGIDVENLTKKSHDEMIETMEPADQNHSQHENGVPSEDLNMSDQPEDSPCAA